MDSAVLRLNEEFMLFVCVASQSSGIAYFVAATAAVGPRRNMAKKERKVKGREGGGRREKG